MANNVMYTTDSGKEVFVNHDGPLETIKTIIRQHDSEIVIELGTGTSGFTHVIRDSLPEDVPVYTFDKYFPWKNKRWDINKEKVLKNCQDLLHRNVHFFEKDIFLYPEIVEGYMICSKAKLFLWCDNGDKVKEVKLFSKLLKAGDMIGIHDWGEEISYSQVEDQIKILMPHRMNKWIKEYKTRFFIK